MSPLPAIQSGNTEPMYNIGVVTRMTGITMATLRAWERRYNFPESERTEGGHRLYSENDILRLRWVKERIDEGMQTARAIHALQMQEHEAHDSLVRPHSIQVASPVEVEDKFERFQENLFKALMQRDLSQADALLGEVLALTTPEDLILEVIGPTFSRIGEAWEKKELGIATEHLATNYLRQRLLMWMLSGPPPKSSRPIVLACAPDEWHEGSLLILGALLRRRRWPVAYLGQSIPLPDMAVFIREIQPPMVIFLAMTETSAANLAEWPQYMPGILQSGRPIIGFGGRIFTLQPEWRLRVAGAYLGDDLHQGMETIERLLGM